MLIILSNNTLFSLLTFGGRNFSAMALWPFIISKLPRRELADSLINHERIHLRQQMECLLFGFYLLYIVEFIYHYFRLKDSHAAYMAISFEVEAYSHESDPEYLKQRKWFASFRKKM